MLTDNVALIKSFPIPSAALRMAGVFTMSPGEPELYLTAEGSRFENEPYSYNCYGIDGNVAFRVSWTDQSMADPDFRPLFGYVEADAPAAMERIDPAKALGTMLVDLTTTSPASIQVNTLDGWSTMPGVRVKNMSLEYGDLPSERGVFKQLIAYFNAGFREDAPASMWLSMDKLNALSLKKYKWDKLAMKGENIDLVRFGWVPLRESAHVYRLDYRPFSCGQVFPKVRVSFVGITYEANDECEKEILL